jgi:hypothetical protein
MNRNALIHAASYAVLVGLLGSWANASDPEPSAEQGVQTKPLSGRQAGAPHSADSLPPRAQNPRRLAHVLGPKTIGGSTAHSYLSRSSSLTAVTAGAAGTAAGVHGISGAPLVSNATRPASGVVGASRRSLMSPKLPAGNVAIGGPRLAAPNVIGGPSNSRTVINASVDGTAFHRRR